MHQEQSDTDPSPGLTYLGLAAGSVSFPATLWVNADLIYSAGMDN